MWKADLLVDEVRVPVKLYAAARDAGVHFRLLHASDRSPVKQRMVDPATGEPVAPEDIRRGVEVENGVFVLLDDEERAQLEPKPARDIVVEQVVDRALVDERWFDRPYYLGPDGDDERYFALAAALEQSHRLCIARWTMRKKRYAGAVHARGGYLLLDTLQAAEEIVPLGAVRAPPDRVPDKREIALAEQLIGTLEDRFDPAAFHDEHRERVLELIESKASGKTLRFAKRKPPKRSDDLTESLEASLAAGRKKAAGERGRKRASGRSAAA
jgi:DNA end-binding protein Ku